MRISNNQIFWQGLNSMLNQQNRVLEMQQRLSTGKKISQASDDPIAAAQINLMKQRIALAERLQNNRQSAEGTLRIEESVLSSSVSTMQRLRELQVQAGNGGMSQNDRYALADEAEKLLDQLLSFANTKDNNGNYIFSGSKTNTETVSRVGNVFTYNGDETQRFQDITSSLQVALNDSGMDLFMRISNGNGRFTVSQAGNTGSASATSGTVFDNGAYVEDDYTINIALNSGGEQVVMVSGVASGNVLPPTGLPDDAPLYASGDAISFNGMQIILEGSPDVGDSFSVSPSQKQSVFTSVVEMIDTLRLSYNTPAEKAAITTENNQILEQIDTAIDVLLNAQAELGSRLNQLDVSEQINSDIILTSTSTLSLLEDADLAETAVSLQLSMVYLQVAQQSFGRIQGLTAFNFI